MPWWILSLRLILIFDSGKATALESPKEFRGTIQELMPEKKTVNLLLASSEGRTSNIIEALVRDVCDDKAVLHCTRVAHVEDFHRQVRDENFDLVILIPEKLPSVTKTPGPRSRYVKTVDVIRQLKTKRRTPTLAVGVPEQHRATLADAGADCVLDVPFKCDEVKSSIRELLYLPLSTPQPSESPKGTLLSWFKKLT